MTYISRITIAAAALLATSACIDDPTQLSDDPFPITQEEAAILGLDAFYAGLTARDESDVTDDADPAPAGAPALAPETVTETASATVPCDLGGSILAAITATGIVDEEAGEFEIDLVLDLTHQDCHTETEENGVLVVNGYPGVTLTFVLTRDGEDAIDVSAALTGGVRLSRDADGASAICLFDLAVEGVETTSETGAYTISGTSCGVPIEQTVNADGSRRR